MRYFIILGIVVILVGMVLYGTQTWDAGPEGQPSPHALDQSE